MAVAFAGPMHHHRSVSTTLAAGEETPHRFPSLRGWSVHRLRRTGEVGTEGGSRLGSGGGPVSFSTRSGGLPVAELTS